GYRRSGRDDRPRRRKKQKIAAGHQYFGAEEIMPGWQNNGRSESYRNLDFGACRRTFAVGCVQRFLINAVHYSIEHGEVRVQLRHAKTQCLFARITRRAIDFHISRRICSTRNIPRRGSIESSGKMWYSSTSTFPIAADDDEGTINPVTVAA